MKYHNRKSDILVTDSTVEVVALAEIKNALKIENNHDDDLLSSYIKTARQLAESYTQRAFITKTRKLTLDSFGKGEVDLPVGMHQIPKEYFYQSGDYIEVPYKPLLTVTSIVTYSLDNSATTFSNTKYTLDTASGRIYLNTGSTWPTSLRNRNAVEVTYTCGYGANPKDVPMAIKQGIMAYASQLYESRGMCAEMPCQVKELLNPYRVLNDNWLC
jgi:hypothetical protein